MKTQTIYTYSLKELVSLGYKERDHEWYLGDGRFPSNRIPRSCEHLLGKRLKLVAVKEGKIEVVHLGEYYNLRPCMVKTEIKPLKTVKTIFKDEVVKFNGYSFDFPCSLKNAGIDDAVEIARWVLKVTKAND